MKKINVIFWKECLLGFIVGLLVLPLRLFFTVFNYITELGMDTIDDYRMDRRLKKLSKED